MGISLLGSSEARWELLATWYRFTSGRTEQAVGKPSRDRIQYTPLWLGLGEFLGRGFKGRGRGR